jgi:hypothetical protein
MHIFTPAQLTRWPRVDRPRSIVAVNTGQEYAMTFALITALQQADPPHSTAPWYIAIPVIAIVLGLSIWRRRRGGGGRGPFGGSGDQ